MRPTADGVAYYVHGLRCFEFVFSELASETVPARGAYARLFCLFACVSDCMYVCADVPRMYMYVCMHACMCMHVCINVCVYACVSYTLYIMLHACTSYRHMHIYECLCLVHTCAHVCMYLPCVVSVV